MHPFGLVAGTTLYLFSILGTYTGAPGQDGRLIEHQQKLVLIAPAHAGKCKDAHVRIQWLNGDGQQVAADSSVTVPGCQTVKIPNPDQFFGIPNTNGVSLRLFSDRRIAGTWVLEPLYEWPTQAIMEEYAVPENRALNRWLFPDVRFDSVAKSQDPNSPTFVPTVDWVAVKVANPQDREVGVNIVFSDGVQIPTIAIPSHGERMVLLHEHHPSPFDGWIKVESSEPVLALAWQLRTAVPYLAAMPTFRVLLPIGDSPRH